MAVVGEPGAGKSFLTRILCKKFYENEILALHIDLTTVRLEAVSDLGDFLLTHACSELPATDRSGKSSTFISWVEENPEKICLVLDGLDRLFEKVEPQTTVVSPDDKLNGKQWLAALLSRKVLCRCSVILTSRKYAITQLEGDLQPQEVLTAGGLKDGDVKKMFCFHFGDDEGRQLFEKIKGKETLAFLKSPINIYLIGKLLKQGHVNPNDLTTHKLYLEVFESFRRTRNVSFAAGGNQGKLAAMEKLCFNLTSRNQFKFSKRDLNDGLTLEDFEKLNMVEVGCTRSAHEMTDEDLNVMFSHQLEQVSFIILLSFQRLKTHYVKRKCTFQSRISLIC